MYYDYMRRFGFGGPTGIDIMSEATGQMPLPGDEYWAESFYRPILTARV
jgi:cell division protein FtsI/penicillin-binding protein 2